MILKPLSWIGSVTCTLVDVSIGDCDGMSKQWVLNGRQMWTTDEHEADQIQVGSFFNNQ
mgnify:CR=1 FL=1